MVGYRFFLRFIAPFVLVFPIWDRNDFETPPVELGPYGVVERRVKLRVAADGAPSGITIFEPDGLVGPKPLFLWVMGSNVQPYYHQSLHETLASYGYVVVCADTRPLTLIPELKYHQRNTKNSREALSLALDGSLGVEIDPTKIAAGGFSSGASLATFVAAKSPEVKSLVFWAPTGSPIWFGINPENLWPQVNQPALYILGTLDVVSPPSGGFPAELMEAMPGSEATVDLIPLGEHGKFQQPNTDSVPISTIPLEEQQALAIQMTLDYLNEQLA